MSKKWRIREFLKPQIPIFPDRLGSWKIEAVLENQYRKWGFHQNLAKSVFDESGKVEKNDEIEDDFFAKFFGALIRHFFSLTLYLTNREKSKKSDEIGHLKFLQFF